MREQGHAFTAIVRDVPVWFAADPDKRRISGPALKEWYEKESARRRK